MTDNPARTPLYEWHAAHGGRLVDFAGWAMPVQYSSIVAEHQATRTACGLFDISHMGRLRFDGAGAERFLDSLVTRRVAGQQPGRIRYALVTNDQGGILDDVLVYHLRDQADQSYFVMVVNAGNRLKILDWLAPRLAAAPDVVCQDVTRHWAMLAVQGPRALDLAQPLVDDVELCSMKYYSGAETGIAGHGGVVSRTGYTGEDGCELMVGAAAVAGIWERLVDAGAVPAGLGCRDTLRLEAAMPLYGHELSEDIDPFQAGLEFAVDLEGRQFPGRDALVSRQSRADRPRRVGLHLAGKRVPRQGFAVTAGNGEVGQVTSGTFSPTLQTPIAMAYVEPAFAGPGTELAVDIRGQAEPARVVPLPFYRRRQPHEGS
jgi:aminomethyltransferase